jgi:hypothetical protein
MKAKSRKKRKRIVYDQADKRAIEGLQRALTEPGPAKRLAKLVAAQEAAGRPAGLKLSPDARRIKAGFERDVKIVAKSAYEENRRIFAGLTATVRDNKGSLSPLPPPRDLLHVFGPDVGGTGGAFFYQLAWTHVDGFGGTEGSATADPHTGVFSAYQHQISGSESSYAGIGVRLTPLLPWCRLSVRPYVNWQGWDILQHRVFDPNVDERRWARASTQVGIIFQSWDFSGGGFYTHPPFWTNLWTRLEQNPVGTREYNDTASAASGFQAELFATGLRQYAIWVTCRAEAFADPGFATATYATCSLNCNLPFLVVEEIPNP